MPTIATILVCSYYRLRDIATLFGLPLFTVEGVLGPGRAPSAKVVALTNQWVAGGYSPFNPALITSGTLSAFQASTLLYVLQQFLIPGATYTDAQVAALFGLTTAQLDDSNLGAGPYATAAILAAASGYPGNGGVLDFANVTPATLAAFNAIA